MGQKQFIILTIHDFPIPSLFYFCEVKNFCYVINFYDLSKFISFVYKHTGSGSLCEVLPYDYCCCQTKGNLHKMQTVALEYNSIERKILTIFNEEIFFVCSTQTPCFKISSLIGSMGKEKYTREN